MNTVWGYVTMLVMVAIMSYAWQFGNPIVMRIHGAARWLLGQYRSRVRLQIYWKTPSLDRIIAETMQRERAEMRRGR